MAGRCRQPAAKHRDAGIDDHGHVGLEPRVPRLPSEARAARDDAGRARMSGPVRSLSSADPVRATNRRRRRPSRLPPGAGRPARPEPRALRRFPMFAGTRSRIRSRAVNSTGRSARTSTCSNRSRDRAARSSAKSLDLKTQHPSKRLERHVRIRRHGPEQHQRPLGRTRRRHRVTDAFASAGETSRRGHAQGTAPRIQSASRTARELPAAPSHQAARPRACSRSRFPKAGAGRRGHRHRTDTRRLPESRRLRLLRASSRTPRHVTELERAANRARLLPLTVTSRSRFERSASMAPRSTSTQGSSRSAFPARGRSIADVRRNGRVIAAIRALGCVVRTRRNAHRHERRWRDAAAVSQRHEPVFAALDRKRCWAGHPAGRRVRSPGALAPPARARRAGCLRSRIRQGWRRRFPLPRQTPIGPD